MIKLDKVSKKFGPKSSILDKISFNINKGEFVFLVGPSGTGKTTILRLFFRDLLPTSGHVFVDGDDVVKLHGSKVPYLRRKIGIVFQDFKLLTTRTVRENIALTLEILEKKEKEMRKKVDEVLDLVGLRDKKHLFPLQLSAGELQRISIARAIVGGPKVLLADEPTGNLDPKTSKDIINIIQEINKLGTTVIMATHNAGIVNKAQKRVIVLSKGKVIRDDKKGQYVYS